MGTYIKNVWGEAVLVALAAMAVSYVALNGFYADPALQHGPVPALVSAVCVAALFAVAKDRKTVRLGGALYAVLLVVAWVAAGALTPAGQLFDDNESNYLIFCMTVTIVPTLVFLLTRRRAGVGVLFAAGVLFMCVIELLYARFELAWGVVFIAAAVALFIFKNYQQSLASATSVRKISMLPGLAVAVAAAILAVGVGAGVWFAVIAPLDPGAVQIKLVTEYRSLETKQVVGTSNIFQEPNTDMTSSETNDGTRTTDDIKEGQDGVKWPATGKEKEPDDQDEQNSFLGIDVDSLQQAFDFQQNPSVRPLALGILLLVVVVVAAYFIGRRIWRRRRLEKLRALGLAAEYEGLFAFLLGRFERIGIQVPAGQTPLEFGRHADDALRVFNEEAGVSFSVLAADYSALAYGKRDMEPQSAANIEAYYGAFYKACRKQMGNLRYFIKSFRL